MPESEDQRHYQAAIWRAQIKEELATVQALVLAGKKVIFKRVHKPWRIVK